jgi:hypothetical protein
MMDSIKFQRCSHNHCRTADRFELLRISYEQWQKDSLAHS